MKLLKKSIPHSVKNWLKLMKFKRLHSAVYIGPGVQIDPNTTAMGKHCGINDYSRVSHSTFGDYTYASRNCNIMNTTIGSYCSIGPGCQMGLGSHPAHFVSTSPIFYSAFGQLNNETWVDKEYYDDFDGVTIEDNVWLGANVIVLDGVTIGEGAIGAAGSVITKDVPPYAIVGGVPAKVMKYRFDEETIAKLIDLRLFDKGEEWLKEHLTGAITPEDLFTTTEQVLERNEQSEQLYG